MDRLNPTITELNQAIEQEGEKYPGARRLMTHPGVGPLTALAFVLIIGKAERFGSGKQVASYLGLVPLPGRIQRESAAASPDHEKSTWKKCRRPGPKCGFRISLSSFGARWERAKSRLWNGM